MTELTVAAQDYLKVIWGLREWTDEPVTTSALSTRLGLSSSTVSEGVRRLADLGLVTHPRYGAITLTDAGERHAVELVRRHRLIETFLADELGYTWDEVHDEAEVLEHAVSARFVDRLAQRLGDPLQDPHGDPIPRPDGTLPPLPAVSLSVVEPDRASRVVRVSDSDADLLRHLADIGLDLGARVTVLAREPYAGTISIRTDGGQRTIGNPVAEAVWVVDV